MEKFDISESDFNPTVFYAGKSKIVADGKYHSHDFVEITFILSGKGKYYVDGTLYEVRSGDVILFNPGVKHQSIDNSEQEPMVEFVTGFTDFHFSGMPANQIVLKDGGHVLRTSVETNRKYPNTAMKWWQSSRGKALDAIL